jgi:hypothetical protein
MLSSGNWPGAVLRTADISTGITSALRSTAEVHLKKCLISAYGQQRTLRLSFLRNNLTMIAVLFAQCLEKRAIVVLA